MRNYKRIDLPHIDDWPWVYDSSAWRWRRRISMFKRSNLRKTFHALKVFKRINGSKATCYTYTAIVRYNSVKSQDRQGIYLLVQKKKPYIL